MWGLKYSLPVWVKPAAVLAVLAVAWSTGWHMRGTHEKARQAKETARYLDMVLDAEKRAVAANDKLRKQLPTPKAEKAHEVIRENPVNCVVPDAVHNSVLDVYAEANRGLQ